MDIPDTVVSTSVLIALGLVLAWMGNRRFDEIDRRFEAIDRRFDTLGSELRGEIAALGTELRTEIRAVRADLTQIALAVGAQQTRDTA